VADIARRYGATHWQIYDWRRRFRRGLLPAAPGEVCTPAFIPVSVVDETQAASHEEIVEVVIDGILIRAGRNAGEAHLARIFRAARASS
jgi:transposase